MIREGIFLIILLQYLACASQVMDSSTSDRPFYKVESIKNQITIDGLLNDQEWGHVESSTNWNDVTTCEGDHYQTTFKSVTDEQYIYIGVYVADSNIRATIIKENQPLFQFDPTIEIFLDPAGDGLEYYEFQINPYGSIWQLKLNKPYKQGGQSTNPFEIVGLKSGVHIDGSINDASDIDKGWSVELAIPWIALKELHPDARTSMNANFARVVQLLNNETASQKYLSWSCAGVLDMHRPDTWGELFLK